MSTTLAVEGSNAGGCNDVVTGPINNALGGSVSVANCLGVISTEDMLICDDTKSLLRITPRTQS